MSLDKSIEHHKEKRREYHGSKSFDRSCRNHGTCKVCEENRKIQLMKELERIKELEEEK